MGSNLQSKVFSGLIWRLAERIGAQGVSFLVSIVLARLLAPSDYGVISMIMIFISLANVFVDAGFGNALIQKKGADTLDFSTVFYFNIIFSTVLYIFIFCLAPPIARFFRMDILCSVLRVLALQIIIAGVKSVQVSYVQKHMLFKLFFRATIGGTVGSGVVGIIMAYCGYGIWALVAQYLLNSFIDTVVLWLLVDWRPTKEFSFTRLKRLFDYGGKILVWSLTCTLYEDLRSLIIGKKYSGEDLAFYTKGKQWPNLIVVNINSSISSVLFPVLSELQDTKDRVKNLTRKTISMSSYVIAPMLTGLAVLSEDIVALVLTDKWLPMVPYMQICCFYLMFMPMQTANLEAIKAIGRSDLILKMDIVKKCVQITILLLTMNFGVMSIALGAVVSTLFSCVVNAWPNKKLLNYSYKEQIADLLPNLFWAGIMGIIVFTVTNLVKGYIGEGAVVILGIAIGVCSYIFLSLVTCNQNYMQLFNLLKQMCISVFSQPQMSEPGR